MVPKCQDRLMILATRCFLAWHRSQLPKSLGSSAPYRQPFRTTENATSLALPGKL